MHYRFRAELHNTVSGLIGIVEADTIEKLRHEIMVEDWPHILQPGDSIVIIDKEEE